MDDMGAAFLQLHQGLRRYLRRRTPDATGVDDMVQDIFIKALASKREGHRIDNLTGWLFAAARTTLADHYRKNGQPALALDDDLPEPEQAEDLQLHTELADCVQAFMAQLPAIYRDTLVATDLNGETMHAVAARLAVSVSAVKSRATRGRRMLREKLLACCHVEMAAGIVHDYHRVSPSGCGDPCGSSTGVPGATVTHLSSQLVGNPGS